MNQAADPYDELAGLFLTEPDMPRAGGHMTGTTVELVVVSHLPVRAGLWLAPYADAMARRVGQTALLRLDDAAPHLQVLRGEGRELNGLPPGATLSQGIASLRQTTPLWVVRPAVESGPQEIAAAGADRITILSSGNEAARVETYTLIKEIVHAAERAGGPVPPMAMAILGCPEETARSVYERLNQTTGSFLGVRLSLLLCLPQVDAGMVSGGYRRFSGEAHPSLAQVLGMIRGAVPSPVRMELPPMSTTVERATAVGAPPAPAAPPAPQPPQPPQHQVWSASPGPVAPAGGEAASAPPVAPGVIDPLPVDSEWRARRTVPMHPAAGVEVEPKDPCLPREPVRDGRPVALAEHVGGLSLLPIRCPGHERVEIAVDGEGGLHLLGREDALRPMLAVRRWAVDHRELIGMACPQVTIDVRRPVRQHLFTEQPLAVHDLVGTDIFLHVLAPVRIGAQVGWYSAPLNKP